MGRGNWGRIDSEGRKRREYSAGLWFFVAPPYPIYSLQLNNGTAPPELDSIANQIKKEN